MHPTHQLASNHNIIYQPIQHLFTSYSHHSKHIYKKYPINSDQPTSNNNSVQLHPKLNKTTHESHKFKSKYTPNSTLCQPPPIIQHHDTHIQFKQKQSPHQNNHPFFALNKYSKETHKNTYKQSIKQSKQVFYQKKHSPSSNLLLKVFSQSNIKQKFNQLKLHKHQSNVDSKIQNSSDEFSSSPKNLSQFNPQKMDFIIEEIDQMPPSLHFTKIINSSFGSNSNQGSPKCRQIKHLKQTKNYFLQNINSNKSKSNKRYLSPYFLNSKKDKKTKGSNSNIPSTLIKNKSNNSLYFPTEKNRQKDNQTYNLNTISLGQKLSLKNISSIRNSFNSSVQKFKVLKIIAKNVFLVLHEATLFLYALKQIQYNSQKDIQNIITQFKVQHFLNHPNIVQSYGMFKKISKAEKQNKIYILIQYMEGQTLQKLIQNSYKQDYNQIESSLLNTFREIFTQILLAVEYIHSHSIIHRDIKPFNIFGSNVIVRLTQNVYKIGDFGSSTYSFSLESVGTLDYISPQIILNEPYDSTIDIWSLGCILYNFYTGMLPFYHKNTKQTVKKIVNVEYNKQILKDQSLKDLISMIFVRKNRIKIKEIKEHPFIKNESNKAKLDIQPNFVNS